MVQAVLNLAPQHRDELCIVLARPYLGGLGGWRLEGYVERWLKRMKLDCIDLLLQGMARPLNERLSERVKRLKESGKVRFFGISSHNRPFLGKIAAETSEPLVDFLNVRYNAVHPGAERDVFPHLPPKSRPGVVTFTATCWRKLLQAHLLPPGERPLEPADCYRFVLSHKDVNVCLTSPSKAKQLKENLKALDGGPLDEEEMARVRAIGTHIYGKK